MKTYPPLSAYRMVLPPQQRITSHAEPAEKTPSAFKRALDYIAKTEVCAPWGYQDNAMVGVGQLMMLGGSQAIERYKDAEKLNVGALEKAALKAIAVFIGILSSPLTVIGAFVKGIGMQFPEKIGQLTSDIMPKTSPKKIDQIYDLVQNFDAVCRQHSLNYFVEGGTLLGAVRNKGIIPWDDDADVGIMEADLAKFKAIEGDLKQRGIDLISYENLGKKMFQIRFTPEIVKNTYQASSKETGFMDIFLYSEREDGTVHYSDTFMRSTYPDGYFHKRNLEQMVEYPFGPPERRLSIKGTSQPEEHLRRLYGKDCLEFGLQSHNHFSLCGIGLPIPNFRMAKYKIIPGDYAKGVNWK